MTTERRLKFIRCEAPTEIYNVINSSGVLIGMVRKERVGSYYHWCFIYDKELFNNPEVDYYFISPGCQDEIREFCRNPAKYRSKYNLAVEY